MSPCALSVVIPCLNGGKHLSEAIESILRQESDAGSIEIVVVDNCSTDEETLAILDTWRHHGPSVRVVSHAAKADPGGARNTGVAASSGAWLAFLDADDVWLPGGLQARWEVIASHPGVEWVAADFQEWYLDGSVEPTGHYQRQNFLGRLLAPAFRANKALVLVRPVESFLRTSPAWTGTVLMKRSLFERVGGFPPGLLIAEDLHLWYRLAVQVDLVFVPRVVALYRQHPESLIHRSRRGGRLGPEWDKVYRSLRRDPDLRPWRRQLRQKLAAVYDSQAWDCRAAGDYRGAARAAIRALSYVPLRPTTWRSLARDLLLAMLGVRSQGPPIPSATPILPSRGGADDHTVA